MMPLGRLISTASSTLRRSVTKPWLACCLVALATAATSRTLSAGLVLNIDTTSKNFYLTGSDTGNAQVDQGFMPWDPVTYSVQFIHHFASNALSASGPIAPSISGLFTGGAGVFSGSLSAVDNQFGPDYVFMDIMSDSSDITTLTGAGPSSASSYASVPASVRAGFESLIGDTLGLSIGTGYSSIAVQAVQAVPEPSTSAMALVGLVWGGYSMFRCRRAR